MTLLPENLPLIQLLLAPVALAAAWALTGMLRRYALASHLMDVPNERSSHTAPTPRGGGVAIVVSFLAITAGLALTGLMDTHLAAALLGGGLVTAVIGFLDDRKPVPARWRFMSHVAAAAWALWCIGQLPAIPIFGIQLDLGWVTSALAALFIVWSINLFNFMDGIDGIASLEAIGIALPGAVLWFMARPEGDWAVAVLFAASVGGFLVWNFPPARIFMGDAGSGFLGMVTSVLALGSAREAPHLFWVWFVLGGCFMVDATMTLVRRVRRGESFHIAHRSHAYQYASRLYRSHKRVSLAVFAINTLWLLPIALAITARWIDGVVGLCIAFTPLVGLAWHYKAGDRAAQGEHS